MRRLSSILRRKPRTPPPLAPSTPTRATLRDVSLQTRLERDGYVVCDVLRPKEIDGLLAAYHALEHHHEDSLPFAEGFHTTLYDSRGSYRLEVREAFEHWLAPALGRVLLDHRIQFANFQVKLPGAEHLPEHLDWTFVDERRARSVTVWTATHAIDGSNGGIGVAPGSHRLLSFDRAVNHRYYDRHAEVAAGIEDRPLLSLDAGQAVVFDNRLLHFSAPNGSDRPRLAASCIATPAEEPVHHYWFDGDDRCHRIEVSPEFWLFYAIGSDPREVRGALSDTLVDGEFA